MTQYLWRYAAMVSIACFGTGCSSLRGPLTMQYSAVTVEFNSENFILPPNAKSPETVAEKIISQLSARVKAKLSKKNDFFVASCGPGVVKLTTGLVGASSKSFGEFTPGFVSSKSEHLEKTKIYVNLTLTDCATGKIIESSEESEEGDNYVETIKETADSIADFALDNQFVRKSL